MSNPEVLQAEPTQPPVEPTRQSRIGRRLVLIVLAVVVFIAALLVLGLDGLIPFGLLLAFSADSDDEGSRRSVTRTRRNLALAIAMAAVFAWFWLGQLALTESTLVLLGGALIAGPLALQDSGDGGAAERTIAVTKRSLILAIWGLVVFVDLYYAYGAELQHAGGGVCRAAARPGRVAGMGCPSRAGRVRAAPPPAQPPGATPPGAGLQHLVVLRAARCCCGRRWHAVRADRVLRDSRAVRGRVLGLRRGTDPAGGVGGRPAPARLPAHQRGRGPAVGLPGCPARPSVGSAHRCGRARLAFGRRVVRAQRWSQRPAQRPLAEREQRCRLPASRGQWADASGRKRRPADRLRRFRVDRLRAGRRTDRRGDRWLRRHSAWHQRRPRQSSGDRHRWRSLPRDGPPQTGQCHGPSGRGRAPRAAGRRGRQQRPLQRAAPAPAGPGLPGRRRRRPDLSDGVPRRRYHQGRCLAVGGQQRASHRRPRPRDSGNENRTGRPSPGPGCPAGGAAAGGGGLRPASGGVRRHLGRPVRPARAGRRSVPGRRRDGTPAVPGCRFADSGVPRRHGLHDDDLGAATRRPGARGPDLRLGLPRRGPFDGRADDDRRPGRILATQHAARRRRCRGQ